MQSEHAARSSLISAPQIKFNFSRIIELLKSPLFKTRMRALIDLIFIPLDPNHSQADKEHRKKILNIHQDYLQAVSAKIHPFTVLIHKLKKANIFISAVKNKTQQSTVADLFSVKNNVSIRESVARGVSNYDTLAEHQLLASAYIYFGDTTRYCSELFTILSSQSSVDSFNLAKIIHLIILNRNNLLQDVSELHQIINIEMKYITDALDMLKRGVAIDPDHREIVINKLQLFTWFDEFKVLIKTTWIPLLLEVLTCFPDDIHHIHLKIFAYDCIENLLNNLSSEELSKFILPRWLNLLSLDQASYMDEIEAYDPKGIRFFYALKLFLCEILPSLKSQDITIMIQIYFTKLDKEVEPGDYKHHVGMICLALLPYCDVALINPRQLRILIEIYWELFHKSSQHEEMNLTPIKELLMNRLFGLLVSAEKMHLLLPYFLEIDQASDFYGESVKVWLNMALDFFTPALIEQVFNKYNVKQILAMLVMPFEEFSLELPAQKLKLFHKLIYMLPPDLLTNCEFDQIWQSIYQDMKQADDDEEQIEYLSLLLVLSVRLPAEKIINYFSRSSNDIVLFINNCFDTLMNYPEYLNLMTMVLDVLMQKLLTVDNPVMQSFAENLYLEISNDKYLTSKNLNCFLWIAARILPMMPNTRVCEAIKWCDKIKVEINISDAEVPRTFLKAFAYLDNHLPKDIYTHFYPMAMISIGQIINVDTIFENLLEPLDDLILLHLSTVSPEFSAMFFTLIMKILTDVIKNVDYQEENESILGNKAMDYFVEMLNSCNNVDIISKYMFSVLPQFLQFYPKVFEKICQGIMLAKDKTLNEDHWRDCFSKNIENSLTKIIVIVCQSPCYRQTLFAELLNQLKQGAPNNISIYLLGSLFADDEANRNKLKQFQQYLNESEKKLIQILSDTNWYMTMPSAITRLGDSTARNINEIKCSKTL